MRTVMPIRVLVAEDEEHLGAILEHFLAGRGYSVAMCRDGQSALKALREGRFDVALLDIVMPGLDGLEVLRQLQTEADPPEVVIITGNGTIDTAITAIRLGAYDYISKPYRMAEIDVMVRRAWEKRTLVRANHCLRERVSTVMPHTLTSLNAAMRATIDHATSLASASDPVVIRGETGVGKTRLARFMHVHSGRPAEMFVEVGPGGTPLVVDQLFEAMLRAEQGTVVIDADAFSREDRATIVSVLTSRAIPVPGSEATSPLLARVIVCERTTDGGEIAPSAFPGTVLTIPSLRDRPEDLGILASELLRDVGDGRPRVAAPDLAAVLRGYAWPGNVRELQLALARTALLTPGKSIGAGDIRVELLWNGGPVRESGAALIDLERVHIESVLMRSNWHQGVAAKTLGISSKTLYRKMREYGLVRPRKRKLNARTLAPSAGGDSGVAVAASGSAGRAPGSAFE